jgi:hypothetical protein
LCRWAGGRQGAAATRLALQAGANAALSVALQPLFQLQPRACGPHLLSLTSGPQDLAAIRRGTLTRLGNDPVLGAPLASAVASWTRAAAAETAVVSAYRRLGHSRAFVKRAADVEAAAPEGVDAGSGVDLGREANLLVEYRKRILCAVKAYIGGRPRQGWGRAGRAAGPPWRGPMQRARPSGARQLGCRRRAHCPGATV